MSIHNGLDDLLNFTKQNLGMDEGRVNQFGQDLAREFGGEYLYVSKRFVTSHRDKEIIAAYNGRNVKELAKQFGLCERQIYNIVSS